MLNLFFMPANRIETWQELANFWWAKLANQLFHTFNGTISRVFFFGSRAEAKKHKMPHFLKMGRYPKKMILYKLSKLMEEQCIPINHDIFLHFFYLFGQPVHRNVCPERRRLILPVFLYEIPLFHLGGPLYQCPVSILSGQLQRCWHRSVEVS